MCAARPVPLGSPVLRRLYGGVSCEGTRAGCGVRLRGVDLCAVDCIFCEIIAGRKDAYRVFEDDCALAFLDTRPLFPGHLLVVPREHAETLTDLPEPDIGPF